MIRAAATSDRDAVLSIAQRVGLFTADELPEIGAMFDAFADGEADGGHLWFVDDEDGPAAVAYVAPEAFADGVWNLYFLAVDPDRQGGGRGARLVAHVERHAAGQGARILLIETSSTEAQALTRTFYAKNGYDEEARIRDYYGPDDDKVVFWKSLA